MVRILAIGDPHGDLDKLKKIDRKGVDLVFCTGDLGRADLARERFFENEKRKNKGLEPLEYDGKFNKSVHMEIYSSSLSVLKYISKIAPTYSISGNVGMSMLYDKNIEKDEKEYGIKLPSLRSGMKAIDDFHLVRNVSRNFGGLRVGFLEYFDDVCWYKEYNNKNKKRIEKAKKQTAKAKKILNNFGSLDVLVCHQPPYGYLDVTNNPNAPKEWKGKHAESKVILDYVKKYKPRYVFCGHIHEGEGHEKLGATEIYNLGVAGHKIINL